LPNQNWRKIVTNTLSETELDHLRRKLKFRAWHRGIKEMDLILGHFADVALETMVEPELLEFSALLEVDDRDLIKWFTGESQTPVEWQTTLFEKIIQNQLFTDSK
jgi:antitoxin CptB